MSNTLSPELKAQIEKEAKHYAQVHCGDPAKFHLPEEYSVFDNAKDDYIAGATAYALKLQQAEKLLAKFISRHEAGLLPDTFIYNEIKTFLDGSK